MIQFRHFSIGVLLGFAALRAAAIPAFPGAEGAGANATGGRGGNVYYVTNLNNSGAGSLRTGVGTANRTIVFAVSGTIELLTDLSITRSNITIAGQTAPGDGITLKRRSLKISNTQNVIVRHIRCRPGDADSAFEDDALSIVSATNVIVDHVSSSWSVDECLSVTHSTNVTIQWSMIAESLKNSQHAKGAHGYGSLLRYGEGALTFHHNLYQHHDNRNPRLGDRLKLDFINNVIYNWGGRAGYSGGNGPTEDAKDNPGGLFTNHLNYVSNYLVAGQSSTTPGTAFASGATNTVIFHAGNRIDSDKNTTHNGTETANSMFSAPYTAAAVRHPVPAASNDTAAIAYQRVLAFVGDSQFRDEVDTRLIHNVRTRTGRLIDAVGTNTQVSDYLTNTIYTTNIVSGTNVVVGTNYVFVRGWPVLNSTAAPLDSDQDGIPNYWESAMNWSTNVANNNHVNTDGYTDLEWYLNWLADRHALCDRNGSVDVNLRSLVGGYTNYAFTVATGSNGSVALLGDGYTARFTATNNFSGLASFTFNASNTVDAALLGVTTVAVLVSTTNAPVSNTAPTLASISNATLIAGATLAFTASATDTDAPPQTLTFSPVNFPSGANVNSGNGQFTWRPAIAQGGTTNNMKIVVTDNGLPNLSATQSFFVAVNVPARPVQSATFSNGQLQLSVTGDAGPDYTVLASTNFLDWTNVFTTNPPTPPFLWNSSDTTNFSQRFYRIQLGP